MTTLNTPGEEALRLECRGKSFVVCGANFSMLQSPRNVLWVIDKIGEKGGGNHGTTSVF